MLHFDCDYMEGAHPEILKRLITINMEKNSGYGTDAYCESARRKICEACDCPEAEVHFLAGGTQTNATVIDGILRNYQGVIAADTGHIATHEAGAIEASGHKVLTLPHINGKLDANLLKEYLETFYSDANHEHMVAPGMVYISHPTEYGSLYTKSELEKLHALCQEYHIPLFLDGARLGYGLMSGDRDITLKDLAKYTDVFYIGGTKVGALFGEAVVIPQPGLLPHFFTLIKQHGGLLAKGWLLGLQFDTLFTDHLYFKIAEQAVSLALKLKKAFTEKGYTLFFDSPTNQQFVILENTQMEKLSKQVSFSFWEKYDNTHTVVRFATSWATSEEDVDQLIHILETEQFRI